MALTPARVAEFNIDWGLYPKDAENPRAIRVWLDVEAGIPYTLNIGTLVAQETLSNIQSIKIDNCDGVNPVTVETGKSHDRHIVPGGYAYYNVLLLGDDFTFTITRADAGRVSIFLLNMPTPVGIFPAGAGASVVVVGTVAVTIADGADVALGAKADAAATTNTGAFSLIALFKRLLSSFFPATATQSSEAYTGATQTLLALNANRRGATIYNDHATTTLYVKLGAVASATSFTQLLQPGSYYELPYGYTGVVDAFASAAAGNARITELAI